MQNFEATAGNFAATAQWRSRSFTVASVSSKRCASGLDDSTSRHLVHAANKLLQQPWLRKVAQLVFHAPTTLVRHVRQHAIGVPACLLSTKPICHRRSTHVLEIGHAHQLLLVQEQPVKPGSASPANVRGLGCIVRSLVPEDLERTCSKFTPLRTTRRRNILEHASLKRDAHFDDKGKHDKLVPMEVDALLAKVTALKEFRGEKDEASDGQESHHHDACGGRPQHQESLVGHSGPNRERVDGA